MVFFWLSPASAGLPPSILASLLVLNPKVLSFCFYVSLATRTYFFPFSYVPIHKLTSWQINFNGTPRSWGNYEGAGATRWSSTMQQPETVFGPYNKKLRSEVR